MNSQGVSGALRVQARVIWALSLRDILGKNSKDKLGYFWQLIQVGFGIAVFWGIREFLGAKSVQNLPQIIFLLSGFGVWRIFSDIALGGISAVSRGQALLTFSQIQPLDLHVSNLVVNWTTQVVVMVIIMWLALAAGYEFSIKDPVSVGIALTGAGLFGLGTGLCYAAICKYIPVAEYILGMIMRVLFFTSGVFFSPTTFGHGVAQILYWNPVTNYIELLRGAFLYRNPSSTLRLPESLLITIAVLAVGMLLERHIRSIPDKT